MLYLTENPKELLLSLMVIKHCTAKLAIVLVPSEISCV